MRETSGSQSLVIGQMSVFCSLLHSNFSLFPPASRPARHENNLEVLCLIILIICWPGNSRAAMSEYQLICTVNGFVLSVCRDGRAPRVCVFPRWENKVQNPTWPQSWKRSNWGKLDLYAVLCLREGQSACSHGTASQLTPPGCCCWKHRLWAAFETLPVAVILLKCSQTL